MTTSAQRAAAVKILKITAHYGRASQPPERRPNGAPTARANTMYTRENSYLHLLTSYRNSARTPIYFSSFCGSGVNNNNFGSWAITSGCHR